MQGSEPINPLSKYRFIPPAKVLQAKQRKLQTQKASVNQSIIETNQQHQKSSQSQIINTPSKSINTNNTKSAKTFMPSRQTRLKIIRTSSQQHAQKVQKQTNSHNLSCNVVGSAKSFFKNKNGKNRLSSAALKSSSKPKYISTEISEPQNQNHQYPKILTKKSTGSIIIKEYIKDRSQENQILSGQTLLIKKLEKQISEHKQRQKVHLDQLNKVKLENSQMKNERQQFLQEAAKVQRKLQENSKKIKLMQRKIHEKCQDHELIITSLKKVINSQFIKIQYLQKQHSSIQAQKSNFNQDSYRSNSMELDDQFQEEREIYEYDQDQEKQEEVPKTIENRQKSSQEALQFLNEIQTYKKPPKKTENSENYSHQVKLNLNTHFSGKGLMTTTPAFAPCTPTDAIKQIQDDQESEESSYNHFNKYVDIQENGQSLNQSAISHSQTNSESQNTNLKERQNIFIVEYSNDSSISSAKKKSNSNTNKKINEKKGTFIKKIGRQMEKIKSIHDKENCEEKSETIKQEKKKVQNVKTKQKQVDPKQNNPCVQSGQQLLMEIDRYLNQWKSK